MPSLRHRRFYSTALSRSRRATPAGRLLPSSLQILLKPWLVLTVQVSVVFVLYCIGFTSMCRHYTIQLVYDNIDLSHPVSCIYLSFHYFITQLSLNYLCIFFDILEICVRVYSGTAIVQSFDIDFRKLFRTGKINLLSPEITSLPTNTIIFLTENSLLVTDVVFNHAKTSPSLKFLNAQISSTKQTDQDAVDFDRVDMKLTNARDKFKKITDVIVRKKLELEQAHFAAVKTRKAIANQAKYAEVIRVCH